MTTARSTTVRDRHRAIIRRGQPACALCGKDIDYSLRYPDPMCFVVDHIIPVIAGGPDELSNKQAAHNTCNREKWHKVEGEPTARTFITTRTW